MTETEKIREGQNKIPIAHSRPARPVFVYQAGTTCPALIVKHVSPDVWEVEGECFSTLSLIAKYHNDQGVMLALADYARDTFPWLARGDGEID